MVERGEAACARASSLQRWGRGGRESWRRDGVWRVHVQAHSHWGAEAYG